MQKFFIRKTKTLIRLREEPDDLSLRWAKVSEGAFSHFMAHILMSEYSKSKG